MDQSVVFIEDETNPDSEDTFSEDISDKDPNIAPQNEAPEVQNLNISTQEANVCPICLEMWGNCGSHRICSLRCGHIFGRSCIERWLGTRLKERPTCPQCNARARRSDITNLYITNLKPADTSKIVQLTAELEKEKSLRFSLESNNFTTNLKVNMLMTELDMLKSENLSLKRKLYALTSNTIESCTKNNGTRCINYNEHKSLKICYQNGCRIMCVHPNNKLILLSKTSENPQLFPGYGICKLNLEIFDCKNYSTEFVRLHKSRIRDLCISKFDPSNLLSCSLDKSLRITNLNSNALVQQYFNPNPIWSCTYDSENPALIYAGLSDGTIAIYDMRNTVSVCDIIKLGSNDSANYFSSPVVSIRPITTFHRSDNSLSMGLIAATSDNVYFIENSGTIKSHLILQPPGKVISITTDPTNQSVLISQRPKGVLKNCQQLVGEIFMIDKNENNRQFNFLARATFDGGASSTLLTRSAIFSPMHDHQSYVAFGNEDEGTIQIHNLNDLSYSHIYSRQGNVVDVAPIWFGDWHYLIALTEGDCTLYKYIV